MTLKDFFYKSAGPVEAKRDAAINAKLEEIADGLEIKIEKHIRKHPGDPEVHITLADSTGFLSKNSILSNVRIHEWDSFFGFRRIKDICKKNDIKIDHKSSVFRKGGLLSEFVLTLNQPYASSYDFTAAAKRGPMLPSPSISSRRGLLPIIAGLFVALAFAAPAHASAMSDAALASYISGQLEAALKDSGYQVSQNCDASGCSVVVQ